MPLKFQTIFLEAVWSLGFVSMGEFLFWLEVTKYGYLLPLYR